MPCYNAASYLNAAIDSILAQSYMDFELILVNDGSTDETEAIIHTYKDERIQYYKQDNKGQCNASNYGLSVAKGDFIKFIDADDLINSEHLEEQIKVIEKNGNAIASCAWGRFRHLPEEAKFTPESVWHDLDSLTWIKKALSQEADMMPLWRWLIPRSVIEKTGGWDERLSLNNDFEFSMRILTNVDEVRFAGNAKLYYRSGHNSLSRILSVKAYDDAILSTDLGCTYLLAKEDSKFTRLLCANRYKEWLYRMYPLDQNLEDKIEDKISELGGANRRIGGGFIFKFLSSMIGWRKAKILRSRLNSYK